MKNWVFEAVALILFLVLGVAGVIAATSISGLSFDPLGSAFAPYTVGTFTILLSAIGFLLMVRRIVKNSTDNPSKGDAEAEESERVYSPREMIEVLALFCIALIYVVAIFRYRVPFSIATILLVPAAACLLERTMKGGIPLIALATGTFIGFGGEFLFSKVFFIDLPVLW